ncbi:MAG: SAM-dependent DNA methyltransferase [Opitutales bacterium]|nr:SAM-dependent DNA methyltransferase [Opitutales bacterium]
MNAREKTSKIVGFLWSIAEDLRGAFKKSENQNVVLPFVVLRRLDHVLAPTKEAVLEAEAKYRDKLEQRDDLLCRTAGYAFYNKSPFTFDSLLDTEGHQLKQNLRAYIVGFSENIQTVFRRFEFDRTLERLDEVGLLYRVMSRFNEKVRPDRDNELNLAPFDPDKNPGGLTNHEMGTLFEELIRRYNEDIKENPGEHFTPKDVIHLLVRLTLTLWPDIERVPGVTVADSTAGTGGMLTVAREEILARNPGCKVHLFGQELNPFTWAICKSDLLILDPSERDPENIKLGSSLSNDQHADRHFDLQFANPPYGNEWRNDQTAVEAEHRRGYNGRFGAGLPRISDGQLLFLQHKLFHMNTDGKPSFVGIVFNGSPLFTGEAGSGESEIRRRVLENDRLYALVALPEQIFYNTGIQTYLWILTNRKPAHARGKVLLLNASGGHFWTQLPKSIGAKRRTLDGHIDDIVGLFRAYEPSDNARVFRSTDFGYRRIQVERPLRLNFAASPGRLERLRGAKAFTSLATAKKRDPEARARGIEAGRREQEAVLAILRTLPAEPVREAARFDKRLKRAFKDAGRKLPAPLKKAVLAALSERDESAPPVVRREIAVVNASEAAASLDPRHGVFGETLRDGMVRLVEYEPDTELRDHENVPLDQSVNTYFDTEVAPHVPDAWINPAFTDHIDGAVGKIGYSINFNRYFYRYQPPRDLREIDRDIKEVEGEILQLLKEVTS